MIIAMISDTHDNISNFYKAIDYFNQRKADYVMHAGDWVSPFMLLKADKIDAKVIGIFGNNEGERKIIMQKAKDLGIEFHDNLWVEKEIDNRKIAMTHGHHPDILKELIDSGKYDLVISGHTHMPLIEKHGDTLHVNPGSAASLRALEPADHFTIAFYDTHTGKAEIVELR